MIMTEEIRMREEGSGASSSALNIEVRKVQTGIRIGINRVDQSQWVNPSLGIIKATIQVIRNEARNLSSAGIVVR